MWAGQQLDTAANSTDTAPQQVRQPGHAIFSTADPVPLNTDHMQIWLQTTPKMTATRALCPVESDAKSSRVQDAFKLTCVG